jgi:peptidoglycan/xylan/chitin deacetylase (PgdA/CDA1 family)
VSVTNPGTSSPASLPFYIINQGFVSLTFDDGYYSAYSGAIPILDAAGIKSTFYVIATLVGDTVDGYVTQAQLQALYKNGHEICNHTRTHSGLVNDFVCSTHQRDKRCPAGLAGVGLQPCDLRLPL